MLFRGKSMRIVTQFADVTDEEKAYNDGYAAGRASADPMELARKIVDGTITEYVDTVTKKFGQYSLCYQEYLITVDLHNAENFLWYAFSENCNMCNFILRKTNKVPKCEASVLMETPIEYGTGYIYVPRDLVDEFKSATNWSTYGDQIRALEDYTVDGTTTGALDESKIEVE